MRNKVEEGSVLEKSRKRSGRGKYNRRKAGSEATEERMTGEKPETKPEKTV